MRVRLITYNIHKGIGGVDRRYRPERIAEVLLHYEPDIVLLQEVDDGVPRSRKDRQVDLFADILEMRHRAYQRNVQLTQGHYGNAILSRFPLTSVENIDLTIPLKKKRRALFTRCIINQDHHQHTLVLVNCHLGLAGFERIMQLRKIVQDRSFRYLHHSTPTIIGGDFNDVWGSLAKQCMQAVNFKPATRQSRTFPAFMPMRQLDNFYFRGEIKLIHCFPGTIEVTKQASDHLPLVADFEIPV